MGTNHAPITFLLNGKLTTASGVASTTTVLNYLRYHLGLVGSKEGCAEGDCGACTVVVAELVDDVLVTGAVNACIQFVPTLHGKALFTVEYLRLRCGDLHPVQQAMVDCHGSQCGFCTPGFIMSMWDVYISHQHQNSVPSDRQMRTALSGNLCRCTGYRPILEAGKKMFELPEVAFDRATFIERLRELQSEQIFEYRDDRHTYFAPQKLEQMTSLKKEMPEATLLAGGTDIGLWVNKQFRDLGNIIYTANVAELRRIHVEDGRLHIGAGVSLNDGFRAIAEHFPQISEQWERFASVPIRNAGTLGGNIANGSPIGDSMPWLITLKAKVKLANHDGSRVLPLEDLYVDYMTNSMQPDEIIEAVLVPVNQPSIIFRTYKLSKRYDSDISSVCAAFAISINEGKIEDARIAFGGMAAIPKRAKATEASLIGQHWNEQTAETAMSRISRDFSPLTDMRASAGNRLQSAQNLLYRFYLETRPENPLAADQVSVYALD